MLFFLGPLGPIDNELIGMYQLLYCTISLAFLIHTLSVDKEISESPNKQECG